MIISVIGVTDQMAWAAIACVVMMGLDIVTGFVGAWKNHDIQSTKMREGLFHKGTLLLLILLAWLCEVFIMHVPELGISVPLVVPACAVIFAMELVSIIENAVMINPELKDTELIKLFDIGSKE